MKKILPQPLPHENRLRLLEVAQVPKDYIEEFKSVSKFKIFNTNNLWLKLKAVKRICLEDAFDLEIIVNNKRIEVDGQSTNVIQLETAIGAAVKCFENSIGIIVNRSRFLPVKKTSDLLLVMSNLYDMSKGSLVMSEKRQFKTTPLIKLGDDHFKGRGREWQLIKRQVKSRMRATFRQTSHPNPFPHKSPQLHIPFQLHPRHARTRPPHRLR